MRLSSGGSGGVALLGNIDASNHRSSHLGHPSAAAMKAISPRPNTPIIPAQQGARLKGSAS